MPAPAPPQPESPPPSRRLSVLVVAAWLAVALWRSGDPILSAGDATVYAILGESLAQGHGYRDLHLIGHPPHRQYPFLYPLLLGGARLAGVPREGLAFMGILAGAVFIWTALRRFWKGFPPGMAPAIVLLAGMGPQIQCAVQTLSDVPAAAIILLSLAAVARYAEAPRVLCREGAAAGAGLLAAAWMRDAALAAAVGSCSWLLCGRKGNWRKAFLLGGMVAAGWLGWTTRDAWRGGGLPGYARASLLLKEPPANDGSPVPGLPMRVRDAVLRDQPVFLTRLALFWLPVDPQPWLCFLFSGLTALGFLRAVLARCSIIEHLVLTTGLILAVTHHQVYDRYLIPLAPFLLSYAAWGVLLVVRGAGRMRRLFQGLVWTLAGIGTFWRAGHPHANQGFMVDTVRAAAFVRTRARAGDGILTSDPASLYWYAGVRGLPTLPDAGYVAEALRNGAVRWILFDASHPYFMTCVRPALHPLRDRLRERWRLDGLILYELLPAEAAGPGSTVLNSDPLY